MNRRGFLRLPAISALGIASVRAIKPNREVQDADAVGAALLELDVFGKHNNKLSLRSVSCRFKMRGAISYDGAVMTNLDIVEIHWTGQRILLDSFSLSDKSGRVLFRGKLAMDLSMMGGDTLRFGVGDIRVDLST